MIIQLDDNSIIDIAITIRKVVYRWHDDDDESALHHEYMHACMQLAYLSKHSRRWCPVNTWAHSLWAPWKVSHTYRYKSCTILSGITAIPLLVDTPNIVVVAKHILFHMVWLIFSFHNTHQRRTPICVSAFTPPLVPLIVSFSPSKSLLLLPLIQYPDRWDTPKQWFIRHYVLH